MSNRKYIVNYCSGSTGYGWRNEYNKLEDFESFVNQMRDEYSAHVTVWDDAQRKFIFWKKCLTFDPDIDLLKRSDRDYRTRTRVRKTL